MPEEAAVAINGCLQGNSMRRSVLLLDYIGAKQDARPGALELHGTRTTVVEGKAVPS